MSEDDPTTDPVSRGGTSTVRLRRADPINWVVESLMCERVVPDGPQLSRQARARNDRDIPVRRAGDPSAAVRESSPRSIGGRRD